ncbi:hypothetical protein LJC46_01220 [Desulfovibrio sp. OttesenSCG-928-G15]|nr:hypothetical protein [Desulfovibrio sp. OttesenSCG-928-G15]
MTTVTLQNSTSHEEPRLNIVLPALASSVAFGGTTSALALTKHLSQHYASCRFVSLFESGVEPEQLAHLKEIVAEPEAVFLGGGGQLACHARDVFLVTYWQGFALWEKLDAERQKKGLPSLAFYYLIQDYEPLFSGFGEQHALALKTYSMGDKTKAVINSNELASYLRSSGAVFSAEYPFRPSLNEDIAAFLQKTRFQLPPKGGDETIILFYGRPGVPRNCFESGLAALRLFFQRLPKAGRHRFTALSVGLPHDDMQLADGAVLKSLGRLPMEQYIALLLRAHVGLSLMISPHPSYPPLEMALFGLPTVTTDYSVKKLAGTHPLLFTAAWPEPEALCAALQQAVLKAGKLKGAAQRAVLPSSYSPLGWQENFASLQIAPVLP